MKKIVIVFLCLALCAGLFFCLKLSKEQDDVNSLELEESSPEHDGGSSLELEKTSSKLPGDSLELEKGENMVKNGEKQVNLSEKSKIEVKIESLPENSEAFEARLRDLAEEVTSSLRIDEAGFSYHHPVVPSGLHLGVKLQVFRKTTEGDETIFRYLNDAGWMSEGYDQNERDVREEFGESLDLENLTLVFEVKSFDLSTGLIQIYDAYIENGELSVFCTEAQQ